MSALTKKSTIGLLLGLPGSGKSWLMTRWLIDEYIPDKTGKFITNLPIKVPEIVRYCSKRYGMEPAEVEDRLIVVPDEINEQWRHGQSTPDTWFNNLWYDYCEKHDLDPEDAEAEAAWHPLCGSVIVLDETMQFCPAKPEKEQKPAVDGLLEFLTTARHDGARLIFCTQDSELVHEGLVRLAGFQIHLTNLGDSRVPYLGVRVDTIFQLLAKTRFLPYLQWVHEQEFLVRARKRELEREARWILWPWVFDFYSSHSKPGERRGKEAPPEYTVYSWPRFLVWFVKQNLFGLGRCFVYLVLILIFIYPGMGFMKMVQWSMREIPALIMPKMSTMKDATAPDGSKIERAGETAGKTATDPAELIEQNEKLREGLRIAAGELLDATTERDRLEVELQASSQMALIDLRGIILSNGDRVNVGEPITAGPYRGRILERCGVETGIALLSDGTELRLRNPRPLGADEPSDVVAERPRPEPTPAIAPNVRGALPGNASGQDTGWYSGGSGFGRAGNAPINIPQPVYQR